MRCKTWTWYNSEIGLINIICGCGIWHNLVIGEYHNLGTDYLFDALIKHELNKPAMKRLRSISLMNNYRSGIEHKFVNPVTDPI
jgi:hypothetical protein